MLDYRESRELWEWENLAPYAAHSSEPSLNWRRSEADEKVRQGDPIHKVRPHHYFPERKANVSLSGDLAGSLSRFKTAFQIDKERLTGSTAFRRLEYKTQVFVTHVGDHYRTRLTHVVEVNETARIIGQALRLNEDLIEAITLGHDLGHTPFGHAGEHTLYEMFKKHWPKEVAMRETEWGIFGPAFYHNVQSVRVVDMLEKGYEWDQRPRTAVNSFDNPLNRRGWGLDLTWAVREGILKHSQRGLKTDDIRMYGSEYLMKELEPFQPATIEGQVVEYADEITSIMHDLEDGLRYRLFTLDELQNSLMKYINQNNLLNLLGLSTDFGVKQDKNLSSRLKKLRDLLDAIEKKKDRTVGNVLALLRTILLSNLIETTSLRLRQALGGFSGANHVNNSHGDLCEENEYLSAIIRIKPDHNPHPTPERPCPEAWDPTSRIDREVKLIHLSYDGHTYRQDHTETSGEIKLIWQQNATRAAQRRMVLVSEGGYSGRRYHLGHLCVKILGSKVVGYSPEVLQLRNWLRKEFIPNYIHRNSMVMRMNDKGQKYIREIFEHFIASPFSMHSRSLKRFGMTKPDPKDPKFLLRIAEHLQGMTDRYLQQIYAHLFLPGGQVFEPDEVTLVDGDRSAFEED